MNHSLTKQDYSRRFLFQKANVRGEFVRLHQAWGEIQSRAQFPETVAPWVAEALVGNALAASTIKFQGQLTLQAKTDGPITTLITQCTSEGTVRGMAQWDHLPDSEANLTETFGQGSLSLTLARRSGGEDYQGTVEFKGESLADALENYFYQSEQLKTLFLFAFDGKEVSGMLLQQLPGEAEDDDGWNRLSMLAKTVKQDELLNLDDQALLYRLFSEEDIQLFDAKDMTFACTCSKERTSMMVLGLGYEEASDIIEEQGSINITCEFCKQNYVFEQDEIQQLFVDGSSGSSALH